MKYVKITQKHVQYVKLCKKIKEICKKIKQNKNMQKLSKYVQMQIYKNKAKQKINAE